MTDIAELGYKVDSSGLQEGTKALDENAAAAQKVSGATDRLERDYQALARTVERSSSVLGDRLGGALDRIGTGTGAVITELQTLNRTNAEILASLGTLDGKLASTAGGLQTMGTASRAAATAETQVATASQQLEQQLAQQDARLRGVAERAMEWASANREANVSERALAEAARDAALGIDHKARAMAAGGTEQDRMVARARALQEAEARTTQESQKAARAAEAQQLNLQKLLGQINPTVAALDKLAEQEDRLSKARDLGLIKPQVYQQYQAQLDATRTKVLSTAQGTDVLSGRLGQLNLRTVETQQSVMMLFRALATGDIGQAQASITSLTARTGALSGVMTATGLAVGAAVAGIAALSVIAVSGYVELRKLEGQVAATGTAAGLTSGQLLTMRREIGSASGSYKEAGAAIEQLVQQGNASGQTLQLMASAAVNLADLTGSSISTTVGEVRSLAEGGADALVKLNDRYNFLTPEIYRHIEAIREQRGDYAATEAALEQLDGTMRDRANSMADSAGVVERAWKGALAAFADTVESIKSIGANDIDSQLQRARDDLEFFQSLSRSPIPGDSSRGSTGADAARQRIVQLQQWKAEMADGAAILGQVRQYDRDVIAAERELAKEREVADQAVKARMAGLDRETAKRQAINKIIADYNKLEDNDARHFDGSMQRLIAKAEADVNRQFNRREGVGKKNGDNTAAQNVLATAQRQIEANKQLVETGIKVTDSERQAMAIEQLLAKSKNAMTASTRALLEAAKEDLLASGQKAVAYTKEKEAAEALARQQAILAQAASNRDRSNELDLLGMSGGSDGVAMLRRQLDIQREYQDELKRLGSRDVAKDKATWDLLAANADAFRNQELAKERAFQDQRLAMLGDWRLGAQVAWQNYAFDATNYNQQAQDAVQGTLAATTSSVASQIDEMVRGNQSLGESLKNIAVDMGNAVIGALEQMAAQWLVYQAVQLATGKATRAASIPAVVATAQATALQAQLAAFASTAAIPIVGPAMAPAAAAAAAAVSQSYVAAISATALAGMAHDGIDSVPTEGTWLLNKGERVLTAGTAAKMDATLDRIASSRAAGPGAGGNVYAPTIQINGDPDARTLAMVEQSVRRGMQQNYDRISSELTTGQGRVGKGLRRGNNVSRRVT
ncbi:phage tail length tape measure family protein [Stenotrophomonas sp.]|uniref:phage tail length tape measure family protein n=1 Tax=Stenotrophomonas sp. TaxID=69392 RepID=UPI002896E009|nr:phage tail length tape measure family protein [Stenotrophomonas sp.]